MNIQRLLWPTSGVAQVSDMELIADLFDGLDIGPPKQITSDIIYEQYCKVKEASDFWIKYYMISLVLLLLTAARAVEELSLFDTRVKLAFLGPIGIVYFCVCTMTYTNFQLKNRMFDTFFERIFTTAGRSERVEILLRYPLAFHGPKFTPFELRPSNMAFTSRHLLSLVPSYVALILGYQAATFGLASLVVYDLYLIIISSELSIAVKVGTLLVLFGTCTVNRIYLRHPRKKHGYKSF